MKLYLLLSLLTVSVHMKKEVRQTNGTFHTDYYDCTGVLVGKDKVITAGHCLEDILGKPWINMPYSSKPLTANVIAVDHLHDLGLMSVPGIASKTFARIGFAPTITDHIYSVHNGNDHIGTYGEGMVENITPFDETTPLMILHSMPIKHGDSGSGIFNIKGELVGINTLTEETYSWAVNTPDIVTFLKAYGVIKAN